MLALGAMILLMAGAVLGERSAAGVNAVAIGVLVLAAVFLLCTAGGAP